MKYVHIIEDTINYIEENLEIDIDLESLANRFYLSKFYFHRIFTAVLGISLKEYMSKRKLNYALELLNSTNIPMVEIALTIGYGTQESFIRAFKGNYGTTPGAIRRGEVNIELVGTPEIVERAFKNLNSDVVTDFSFVERQEMNLVGFFTKVDLDDKDIQKKVWEKTKRFTENSQIKKTLNKSDAFSVFFSNRESSRVIDTFFGIENLLGLSGDKDLSTLTVPPMLYAKLRYKGDMLFIGETVIKDIHRWMKISKIEVEPMDISFMQLYDKEYNENLGFELHLPIHRLPQGM